MSFGFGVSDFITLATFTWQVVERCRSSTAQFKDISHEVSNLHFVLKQIEKLLKQSTLSPEEQYELSQICQPCKESLKELEGLLDKHSSLLSVHKRPLDIARWASRDMGAIRAKLHGNIMSLLAFNVTLCSVRTGSILTNQTGSIERQIQMLAMQTDSNERHIELLAGQAQILETMNIIKQEYEEGTRQRPAYSQVQPKDLAKDNSAAWEEITSELEAAGVERKSTALNESFIRAWIDEVVNPAIPDSVESNLDHKLHDNYNRSTTPGPHAPPHVSTTLRGSSTDTHAPLPSSRSFSDSNPTTAMTLRDQLDFSEAQHLLLGIIDKFTKDDGLTFEEVKSVFDLLRKPGQDFVLQVHLEDCVQRMNTARETPLKGSVLTSLIDAREVERNGRCLLEEWGDLIYSLCSAYSAAERENLLAFCTLSNERGRQQALAEIQRLVKMENLQFCPPLCWAVDRGQDSNRYQLLKFSRRPPEDPVDHIYLLDGEPVGSGPMLDIESFQGMSIVTTKILLPKLNSFLSAWEPFLETLELHHRSEYESSLQAIFDAATKFYDLQGSQSAYARNILDWPFEAARYLPYASILQTCPSNLLLEIRSRCLELFTLIEGCVYDLVESSDTLLIPSQPLDLIPSTDGRRSSYHGELENAPWQLLRMKDRANLIKKLSATWDDIQDDIKLCSPWLNENDVNFESRICDHMADTIDFRKFQKSLRTVNRVILQIRDFEGLSSRLPMQSKGVLRRKVATSVEDLGIDVEHHSSTGGNPVESHGSPGWLFTFNARKDDSVSIRIRLPKTGSLQTFIHFFELQHFTEGVSIEMTQRMDEYPIILDKPSVKMLVSISIHEQCLLSPEKQAVGMKEEWTSKEDLFGRSYYESQDERRSTIILSAPPQAKFPCGGPTRSDLRQRFEVRDRGRQDGISASSSCHAGNEDEVIVSDGSVVHGHNTEMSRQDAAPTSSETGESLFGPFSLVILLLSILFCCVKLWLWIEQFLQAVGIRLGLL
ncbi:uncharacterized protein PV07_09337 [Cladophialophora immunda]|uniref:Fungal N-terminal domain-containing protein n=1 Tax=Cladophialophora immunda TaxID=569365 RepID=A0A0D2CRI2_9EURO|nr:uncharacterized protein PV07_09337 [Cladophialophora immunda]KIW26224.1 hypothetical protein PV07_09337 [Cladophialophora immunda]